VLIKAAEVTVATLNDYQIRPSDLDRALTRAVGRGMFRFDDVLTDCSRDRAVRILIEENACIWRDHPDSGVVVIDVRSGRPDRGYFRLLLHRPFRFDEIPQPPPKQTPPQRKLLLL